VETYRNEQVWHQFLVFGPALSILASTSLDIPPSTVTNHAEEEDRIKPWKRAIEASD